MQQVYQQHSKTISECVSQIKYSVKLSNFHFANLHIEHRKSVACGDVPESYFFV